MGRVAILTYHSLDEGGSVLSTPPRLFADQMRILRDLGVSVVPLSEVPGLIAGAPGGPPRVAITFDDGFRSLHEHAVPILQRCKFPATVFLVTDHCGRTSAWPGQPAAIEPRALLTWSEVRELSRAGITFGSHTRTHPDLTRMPGKEAEAEMVGSKKAIEDAIGRPVAEHAYPYGAHDDAVRHLAAIHFRLACSAALGFASRGSDPFALERLDMYYLRRPALFRRLFTPGVGAYLSLRRGLRDLRTRARGPAWGG